jgi:ABC-type sugar transport system substrate-binding protein
MSALRDGARRAALLALAASLGCASIGAAAQGLPAVTSGPTRDNPFFRRYRLQSKPNDNSTAIF